LLVLLAQLGQAAFKFTIALSQFFGLHLFFGV